MARTGPQKIPGALLDLFFGSGRYGGSDMEVNVGLLHTTEGATLVDYDSGAVAPTVTGVPDFAARQLRWHQHFDVDESARALVNAPGGVQTNTLNVFQIELVGTCDPATHARWTSQGVQHIYWPDPPDWAVRDLAWLMRWLHDEHGIPLTGVAEWVPYPASYGATRVRMTFDQWTNFRGWCGHQHAPENVHGDPGALPFARILAAASGTPTTTPAPTAPAASQEDNVTPQEFLSTPLGKQYAVATPNGPFVPTVADALNGGAYATQKAEQALLAARDVAARVDALAAKVSTGGGLTAAQTQAAAEAGARAALSQLAALLTTPKGN